MHASKGREYEAVVIFDYAADLDILEDQEVEEERRVFYVGMTRAHDSLLITFDGSKPLHRFVRESIAPVLPNERHEIDGKRFVLEGQQRKATIDQKRANDKLSEIADGRKLARLEAKLAKTQKVVESLESELEETRAKLGKLGIWQWFLGQKSQFEKKVAETDQDLTVRRSELSELDDEVTYLRADPERYKEPFVREVEEATRRLRDLDQQERALSDRLDQLDLIGG